MIGRFTHLFKKRAEKGAMRKKAEAMFSSKREVEINGNGTCEFRSVLVTWVRFKFYVHALE